MGVDAEATALPEVGMDQEADEEDTDRHQDSMDEDVVGTDLRRPA